MEQIIAGRFETKGIADTVASVLRAFVDDADICIFHNNPPGQHDAYPVGGDEDEDPGAEGAENSSVGTALAAGLAAGAIGALGGPVVAIGAAAVGAYTGSLMGAMSGLGDHEDAPGKEERRPGGIILSVRIAYPSNEDRVIDVLRKEGAAGIERARGEWRDGDWADFDPVAAPQLVGYARMPSLQEEASPKAVMTPVAKSLETQKADFTAEGAPPPASTAPVPGSKATAADIKGTAKK